MRGSGARPDDSSPVRPQSPRSRRSPQGGRLPSGDGGQVLLLTLVFGLIGIALVTVVVSASAVHLQRKQLLAVADAAALDAADALDEPGYYSGATGPTADGGVPLTDASVRASVQQYLTAASVGFDGLSVGAPTGTPDGQTAQVTLLAVARLPLVSSVLAPWSDGVPLRVTARARTELG